MSRFHSTSALLRALYCTEQIACHKPLSLIDSTLFQGQAVRLDTAIFGPGSAVDLTTRFSPEKRAVRGGSLTATKGGLVGILARRDWILRFWHYAPRWRRFDCV